MPGSRYKPGGWSLIIASRFGFVLAGVFAAACGDSSPSIDAAMRDAGLEADGAPGVVCRAAECAPDEVCCDEIVVPPRPTGFCLAADVTGGCDGTTYACDGPEDCPTDGGPGFCCADLDDVACGPPGGCPGTVVCHDDDDCPGGGTCGRTSGAVVEVCI